MMLASPPDLWGQDCIDFEAIDEVLDELPVVCQCNNPIQLGEQGKTTYITEYSLNSIQFDQCFEIFGTLVMDESMYFEDCDFIMDDGALIQLQTSFGRPFVFINSTFQTCGDFLWEGINLLSEAQILFAGNTFQHSLNGIHGSSNQVLGFFFDNIFNDNYFAIDLGVLMGARSAITAKGNIFAQHNDMKEHWEEPLPEFLDFTQGIRLRNCLFDADASANPCDQTNIYYKLNRGTDLFNCHSFIHSNLYHQFREREDDNYPSYGIHAGNFGTTIRSYLDQSGWPTHHVESFNEVALSLFTQSTITRIKNNIIRESFEAIRVFSPRATCEILNNTMDASLTGIRVQNNYARLLQVTGNNVNIDFEPSSFSANTISYGIQVDYNRLASQNGVISNNSVIIDSAHFGILMVNASENGLACNLVRIMETSDTYTSGIEIRGGDFNSLRENRVEAFYSTSTADEVNALKIIESTDIQIIANELSDTEFGLHFSGWCAATNQLRNEFNTHSIGYYVDPAGITGQQRFPGNLWLGTYSDWGARNDNMELDPSAYIDHINFFNTDCLPEDVEPISGWFFLDLSQGICGAPILTIGCLEKQGPVRTDPMHLDTLIGRGELSFDHFPERRTWRAERYLYDILDRFPDLAVHSNPLDSFWTETQDSETADLQALWAAFDEAANIPLSLQEEMLEADSLVGLKMSELSEVAYLLDQYPDSLDLWDEIYILTGQMNSIMEQVELDYDNWHTTAVSTMTTLLQQLDSLSEPSNHYAYNETIILEALIGQFIEPDTMDPGMENALKAIATGCILEEGPSVFHAYALLSGQGIEMLSLDFFCEDTDNQRAADVREVSPASSFKLFPNPSSGSLKLLFDKPIQQSASLQVLDITGKPVFRTRVPALTESFDLNLTTLPEGQYLIRLESEKFSELSPVIIVK